MLCVDHVKVTGKEVPTMKQLYCKSPVGENTLTIPDADDFLIFFIFGHWDPFHVTGSNPGP